MPLHVRARSKSPAPSSKGRPSSSGRSQSPGADGDLLQRTSTIPEDRMVSKTELTLSAFIAGNILLLGKKLEHEHEDQSSPMSQYAQYILDFFAEHGPTSALHFYTSAAVIAGSFICVTLVINFLSGIFINYVMPSRLKRNIASASGIAGGFVNSMNFLLIQVCLVAIVVCTIWPAMYAVLCALMTKHFDSFTAGSMKEVTGQVGGLVLELIVAVRAQFQAVMDSGYLSYCSPSKVLLEGTGAAALLEKFLPGVDLGGIPGQLDETAITFTALGFLFYGDVFFPRAVFLVGFMVALLISGNVVPASIRAGAAAGSWIPLDQAGGMAGSILTMVATPATFYSIWNMWQVYGGSFSLRTYMVESPVSPWSVQGLKATAGGAFAIGTLLGSPTLGLVDCTIPKAMDMHGLDYHCDMDWKVSLASCLLVGLLSFLLGTNWSSWLIKKTEFTSAKLNYAIAAPVIFKAMHYLLPLFVCCVDALPFNGGLKLLRYDHTDGHHLDGDNDLHLVVPGTVATLTLYAALQVPMIMRVSYEVYDEDKSHFLQAMQFAQSSFTKPFSDMYAVLFYLNVVSMVCHTFLPAVLLDSQFLMQRVDVSIMMQFVVGLSVFRLTVWLTNKTDIISPDALMSASSAALGYLLLTMYSEDCTGSVLFCQTQQLADRSPTVLCILFGYLVQRYFRAKRTEDPNALLKRLSNIHYYGSILMFFAANAYLAHEVGGVASDAFGNNTDPKMGL